MRYYELFEDQVLDEMPMPSDWDHSVFKPDVSYAKRIKYAVERALKIGKGSSRSAFVITVDGRDTVLKVAHNKKGLAQNAAEAAILSDGYVQQLDITIPMIDYDEEHPEPLWINTERAMKGSESLLCNYMKCDSLFQIVNYADNMLTGRPPASTEKSVLEKHGEEGLEIFKDYAQRLAELSSSGDVKLVDFQHAPNWGFYKNHPVVLDVGFTSSVHSSHYS